MAPTESGGRVYVPNGPIVNNPGLVGFAHADRWYQNNNLGALGPRLGIAWAPGGSRKPVFPAGWGISVDPLGPFPVAWAAGKIPGPTPDFKPVPARPAKPRGQAGA